MKTTIVCWAFVATIFSAGCGSSSSSGAAPCGAGTVEVNGTCVPQCGSGTVLVKGVCVVGGTGGTGVSAGGNAGIAGASGSGGSATAGGPGAGTGGVPAGGGGGGSGTTGGGNAGTAGGTAGAGGVVATCAPDGKPVADPQDDPCPPKGVPFPTSSGDCLGTCKSSAPIAGCVDASLSCTSSGLNNIDGMPNGLSSNPHVIFRTPSHPGCIGACAPPMCPPAPGAKPIYTLRIDIDQGSEITSILRATFFVDAPWHAYFDYAQHIPNDSNSECGMSVPNCTPFSLLSHNALYVWTDDPNAPARNVHVIGGCVKAAGCPGAKFSDIVALCQTL